jgi:hypothetical protein
MLCETCDPCHDRSLLLHRLLFGLLPFLWQSEYGPAQGPSTLAMQPVLWLNLRHAWQLRFSSSPLAFLSLSVVPWNPAFYMFHRPTTLSRFLPLSLPLSLSLSPNGPFSSLRPNIAQANGPISASPLDIENFLVNEVLCCCCNCCGCRHGHCACCGQPSEAMLLPYKLAQISLFTIGCCSGCGLYQWVGGEPLQHRIGTEMALLTSPHPLSLSVSRASIARN